MEHLNFNQQLAVKTVKGRVLILAGAGSGKTRVLVHRIAHLIKVHNVSPSSILGLTFTNKAADEMRERVKKLVYSELANQVILSTFHSFCMKVLKKNIHKLGFTSRFTLYDERDMRRLIAQIAEETYTGDTLSVDPIIKTIFYIKANGLDSEEFPTTSDTKYNTFIKEVYENLLIALRAHNALDFDFLLILTYKLFQKFPDVLEHYQDQFRYIMIDEYQDTNPIQYRIASILSEKYQNLCVVGDDDQSIYSWRGAEIKHILDFDADTTIKLEHNYRSTSKILQAANSVIQNNTVRHNKTLKSNSEEGETLEIFNTPNEQDEVEAVIKRILHLKEAHNLQWNEIAILYRSNSLARSFELSLMQTVWKKNNQWTRGIPYQVFGGIEFTERSEIKDLIAYLRIIANPLDQEALLRIINFPRRGISDRTLDVITQFNRQEKLPLIEVLKKIAKAPIPELKLSSRSQLAIKSFITLYREITEKFQTPPLFQSLLWLIEKIQYKQTISNEVKNEKNRELKLENIQAYVDSLKYYEEEEGSCLEDFLSSSMVDKRKRSKKISDHLNLMTFHSAKGLEFPVVFLIGLEDHIIPHIKNQTKEGIEEERRLLYVAITRAMKHLCLSMSQKRNQHGKSVSCNPSRFLFEIPKDLIKVTSWK